MLLPNDLREAAPNGDSRKAKTPEVLQCASNFSSESLIVANHVGNSQTNGAESKPRPDAHLDRRGRRAKLKLKLGNKPCEAPGLGYDCSINSDGFVALAAA